MPDDGGSRPPKSERRDVLLNLLFTYYRKAGFSRQSNLIIPNAIREHYIATYGLAKDTNF